MSAFKMNEAQARAATSLVGPVLVTAGAGSGKTRVLTERTVNAIVPGAVEGWTPITVDQVLEITFTDKAAGELADRVRATLRSAGLHDQARKVDAAWISTIHSMCSRILRTEALVAGIDPGFTMLDTVTVGRLREGAFDKVAREAMLGEGSRLFEFWGYSSVAGMVMRLAEDLRIRGADTSVFEVADAEAVTALAHEALQFFKAKIHHFGSCGSEDEAVSIHGGACTKTAAALEDLLEAGLADEDLGEALWGRLAAHEIVKRCKGAKVIKGDIEEIEATRADLCSRLAGAITMPTARALIALTDEYARAFATLKREQNGLDFTDLQAETRRILQVPEVAARWRDRFKLTMVDEFQDTDALQLEIVRALAGENLCTVGDENQAIYRFRGADIEVFRQHKQDMAARGAVSAVLGENYRSHPEILAFVNRLFGSEQFFAEQVVALTPGRDEPLPPFVGPAQPRTEIIVAQLDKSAGTDSDAARRSLAKQIAERIHALRTENGVALGDIVILMSAYTHAHVYADALADMDIETSVVGGSRFFNQPEIYALRAALRTISNRNDETGVAAFLASSLCGLSDEGLLSLRRYSTEGGCGLWGALVEAPLGTEDARRARAAARAVDDAGAVLGGTPLGEVILRFIEDCGFDLQMIAAGPEGRRAYANVLKLARMAGSYEAAGGSGVAGFLDYLGDKERYREHEAPAGLVAADEAAVRIMSIHASKGLEFPVVFVPGLDAAPRVDQAIAMCERGRGQAASSLSMALPSSWGGKRELRCPPEFVRLERIETDANQMERKRLLYVACTRARELLVLTGARTFKESTASTMLNWTVEALGLPLVKGIDSSSDLGGGTRVRLRTVTPDQVDETGLAQDASAMQSECSWWLDQSEDAPPPEALKPPPRSLSYSAIRVFRQCRLRFYAEKVLGLATAREEPSLAIRLGSALHALLQTAGETEELDEEAAQSIARFHGLDADGLERAMCALETYRSCSTAARVRAAAGVRREVPFNVWVGDPGNGFVLDGTIDTYAREGDSVLIVDYKTGVRVREDSELRAQFELQARCYAYAAAVEGANDIEAVFVRPEVIIEGAPQLVSYKYSSEEALLLAPELAAMYREMKTGSWPHCERWSDEVCRGCPVLGQMCPIKAARMASLAV